MRKVYFLRHYEEDGAVLDALASQGIDPDELANPACPLCGRGLLPAYVTDHDFRVVTWFCLTDADECAGAQAWYLVCSNFACDYEEQVERVSEPAGACIFDLEESHLALDEETGLFSAGPDHLQRLILDLRQQHTRRAGRKLACLLDEAEGRYTHELHAVRRWLCQVPFRHWVRFQAGELELQGRLLAATDGGILLETDPGGDWLVVEAAAIRYYGPRFFGPDAELPPEESLRDGHSIVMVPADFVIMRGYHLQLSHVDRFGRYYVCSGDERVARALNLKRVSDRVWEGLFRRTEIDGRYERQRLLKIAGHWVELFGPTEEEGMLAVRTTEAEVARALNLKPWRSWGEVDLPPARRSICFWYGFVPRSQVEEEKELRLYHWPLPEAGDSRRDGASKQA